MMFITRIIKWFIEHIGLLIRDTDFENNLFTGDEDEKYINHNNMVK